jgi:hypothetical protein
MEIYLSVSEKIYILKVEVGDKKYVTLTRPACYNHSQYGVGGSLLQKPVVTVRKLFLAQFQSSTELLYIQLNK